jgi:hypothetical protein
MTHRQLGQHLQETAGDLDFGHRRGRARHGPWLFATPGIHARELGGGSFLAQLCCKKELGVWYHLLEVPDERFFGRREADVPEQELWKTREQLLNQDEQDAMESLVQIKVEESKERVLV